MSKPDKTKRGETITSRTSVKPKLLTDRAACREAESALLDRCYFALSGDAFRWLTSMLDRPPEDNPRLRRLLQTKAPWDR